MTWEVLLALWGGGDGQSEGGQHIEHVWFRFILFVLEMGPAKWPRLALDLGSHGPPASAS